MDPFEVYGECSGGLSWFGRAGEDGASVGGFIEGCYVDLPGGGGPRHFAFGHSGVCAVGLSAY